MKQKTTYLIMAIYLIFSLLGLLIPWYYNLQHILYSPISFTIAEYYRQGTQTPLAASITYDFFIGTTPALIWMMIEGKKLRMKFLGLFFIGTFAIAFAFTYPLFLFFRELKLKENNNLQKNQ